MQIFHYQPPALPWLDIRYRDRDLIVISKPSGLLSNPGRAPETHDCALTRLQRLYPDTLLVHRLDCATSGIMVFARNKKAESNLKTQFQDRHTEKLYIAEVAGIVEPDEGEIDLPLGADKLNPPWQQVDIEGKSALTRFKVLERRQDSTLLQLMPLTGRTHQLRVHMLALGHPILGDDFYGQDTPFADTTVELARPRLCLHAQSLSLSHPYSGKPLQFVSPHPFSGS
ncbi:RluA family pseudouridine synthase [Shewanella sedimentimangrovi]|uniref:Pseudouridine synthase n=1 Tax=Shewanella sedimentimangrovi TaxID=2814293 RepID=A0ABX7QWU8_9GAMM|nr:RluA family pseudouridine synthase [Shewanella sedimentimangrovi]QSX35982.1 RluA family pseudouridine synthase [Shewanella sedimentimangrovi]